jgi:hypothetical protein
VFGFFLPGLSLEVNVIVRYDPNYFGILILITDLLKSQRIAINIENPSLHTQKKIKEQSFLN